MKEGLEQEESLKKSIREVILPKYPWIKDFDVIVSKDGVQNLYSVRYYIDNSLLVKMSVGREFILSDVKSATKNLYDVIEQNDYDFWQGVTFHSYEDYKD